MQLRRDVSRTNLSAAKRKWSTQMNPSTIQALRLLTQAYQFSVLRGDLLLLGSGWYVTHTGLIRLAARKRCRGIHVQPIAEFSDSINRRYAFKATVYKSDACQGFVGYGDADPSNVSFLVHGAEMRVAETRAVNRALRKAYGIGICSVEEIGSFAEPSAVLPRVKEAPSATSQWQRKPRQPESSRPPLPIDSPASTRSQLGQGLRH